MKKIILFSLFTIVVMANLQAQDPLRTTYPVDSCLYFMDPFQFRLQTVGTLPGGGGNFAVTLFRSSGTPDLFISGRGRFAFDPSSLPPGIVLGPQTTGNLLLSVPPPPSNGGNWPGGTPPFPLILYGFLESVEGQTLDPLIPITIQVQTILYEDTTQ